MEIIYRLIRDVCLFIIIGVFLTEDPILMKLLISLFALVIYFIMDKNIETVESNKN